MMYDAILRARAQTGVEWAVDGRIDPFGAASDLSLILEALP